MIRIAEIEAFLHKRNVGDRVFVGVMSLDRRRFFGYNYVTLTEENLQRGYVLINIVIK